RQVHDAGRVRRVQRLRPCRLVPDRGAHGAERLPGRPDARRGTARGRAEHPQQRPRLRRRYRAREVRALVQQRRLLAAGPMTAPTSDTRFFVAHMQKTAGTSLRDRLRATFDEAQIYPNRTDGPDARIAVISVQHLLDRWAVRGDEIRLLTGHFPVSTAELIDA